MRLPSYSQEQKRRHSLSILEDIAGSASSAAPGAQLPSAPSMCPRGVLTLRPAQRSAELSVSNPHESLPATAWLLGEAGPGGGGTFLPPWLEVSPRVASVPPGGVATFAVRGADYLSSNMEEAVPGGTGLWGGGAGLGLGGGEGGVLEALLRLVVCPLGMEHTLALHTTHAAPGKAPVATLVAPQQQQQQRLLVHVKYYK